MIDKSSQSLLASEKYRPCIENNANEYGTLCRDQSSAGEFYNTKTASLLDYVMLGQSSDDIHVQLLNQVFSVLAIC